MTHIKLNLDKMTLFSLINPSSTKPAGNPMIIRGEVKVGWPTFMNVLGVRISELLIDAEWRFSNDDS
jgi:hypothetical protein